MRRTFVLAAVLVAAAATSTDLAAQAPRPVNPVGTYTVSTSTDTGQTMTGTLVITGGPDGYGGSFSSPALQAPVTVASVATNVKDLMVTINNGRGGYVLVWVQVEADGTFKGTWHDLAPGIPASGRKTR